jgi:transcriptional regulator with XRE-family HTH domain
LEPTRRKDDRNECQTRSTPLPHLRKLRQSAGLTQRELARRAGVSPGTIYRLENALRGSYPYTVRRLAAGLGVSTEELVKGHRRK